MEYYDPIDHTSKRYALIATIATLALCAVVVGRLSVDVHPATPTSVELVVELVEEEPAEVVEKPKPPTPQPVQKTVAPDKAPAHVEEAPVEQSQQTSGEAEQTTTINPDALFKPVVGSSSEQVPMGNRLAPEGDEEQHSGEGDGYNLMGDATLDQGLQKRGLREGLPRPTSSYRETGMVVVRIEVDSEGNVVSAEPIQEGSTTMDATLCRLAREAALKAKFNPSGSMAQGGTITYVFTRK